MNQAYDVFLCYHSRDREPVERVAGWLREQGLNPFLDRWYLPAGQPWPQVLERVLGSCRGVAVFIGPGEMGTWQLRERDLALERQSHTPGFPVIPVLLPESVPVAGFLGQNTWVDLRQWIYDPTSLATLAAAIRGESPGPDLPRRVYAPLAELSPYRGLCYFREEDAPFFFGRESAIDSLFDTIQCSRLIAVVGASGCGKSSVVRAGLVPKLRQNRQAPWEIITLVPGDDPLKAIAMACLPSLEIEMTEIDRLIEANKLARALASGDASLHDVATRILEKQPGTAGVLLIADQWEELYTLTRDEGIRRRFIDEILESTQRGVLSVVLTLRGDFVGKALAYRPLSDRLQNVQINLGPMNRAELESAIERPAEKVGLAFEPGLAERILDDVGDEPGNLPLLEFVLWELWDERRRGVLLHEAYDQMGGLKGAVAKKADDIFDLLSPQDQQAVKKVFLQLVHPGEGVDDSDVTRRRAPRAEIGETAWEVVKKLADARLLVTEHGKEEDTVEVSHEALVRHWKRLRSWIKEDRAFMLWHERFRARFHDWDRSTRGTLLKGMVLADARRWLSERREAFSAHEREFIEKSRRVGWIWNVTLITGGVSFVVMVAWLLVTYKVAEAARSEAAAGRLATAARHEMEGKNFDLALLLANAASLKNPTPQAVGALVSALSQRPELSSFLRPTHRVISVAFSPDGKLLASGDTDGTIILWDVKSAKPLGEPLREHDGSVHSLGFSADGKWLASGSTDDTVILWSVMSQLKLDKRLKGDLDRITSVAFSPDGKLLASGSWDNTVLLWNVESGDRRGTLRGHKGSVLSVAFSNPDGELLASGSADHTVILWDVADPDHPRQHGEPLEGYEGSVNSLSFSSDGKWLGSGSGDKSVILWDVTDPDHPRQRGEPLKGQDGSISGLAFSPDGTLLASGSDNGTIMVWDIETQMRRGEPLSHAGEVMSLMFNQAGQLLASGIDKHAVRLWHVGRRTRIGDFLKAHQTDVTSVAFSPDGKLLASGSKDGAVIFWDIETRRPKAMEAQEKAVESVAFSADGKVLAGGTAGNTIVLWDVERRKQMGTPLKGHKDKVSSVAFSPDGKWLASGSFDGAVILWNTSGKQPTKRKRLGEHKKAVESVAFSPDSTLLASGSADNTVIFWDFRNEGQVYKRLEGRGKPLYSVAFSADGKLLAGGDADDTVILWDVAGGEQTQPYLKEHEGYVYSLAFSPDGKWVASGGEDGMVNLWDVESRASLGQLEGHDSGVLSVAFSADGKWLASGSSDGTVILWDVNLKSWQDRACLTVNRDFTCEEWRRYVGNEPYQPICHRLLPPNAGCQTDLP